MSKKAGSSIILLLTGILIGALCSFALFSTISGQSAENISSTKKQNETLDSEKGRSPKENSLADNDNICEKNAPGRGTLLNQQTAIKDMDASVSSKNTSEDTSEVRNETTYTSMHADGEPLPGHQSILLPVPSSTVIYTTVNDSALYANHYPTRPCVDPPSVRRKAYNSTY